MAANDESDLLTPEDRAFAKALRTEREAAGLTQGDLAERLVVRGLAHVSQVTLSRIEHGKRAARLGEAEAIAEALEIPLALMTVVDERVESAKTLSWGVGELNRMQMEVSDLAQKLGQKWVAVEALYELVTRDDADERRRADDLPPETSRALAEYYEEARYALSWPAVRIFESSFEAGKAQAIDDAKRRSNGAAADAD